jgi:hypothetical protein
MLAVRYENALYAPLLFWINDAPGSHRAELGKFALRNHLEGKLTKRCGCRDAFDFADSEVDVLASGIKQKTARWESTGPVD